MYGLRADRSLCIDSVGLLRHWWRCSRAGRGLSNLWRFRSGNRSGRTAITLTHKTEHENFVVRVIEVGPDRCSGSRLPGEPETQLPHSTADKDAHQFVEDLQTGIRETHSQRIDRACWGDGAYHLHHQRLAPQADNLHHEMLPMFLPIETSTPDDPEPDRIDPHPEEPDRIDPGDPEPDDPEEPDRIDPDEHDPGDPEQAPVVG